MKNKIEYFFFLFFGLIFSALGLNLSRKTAGFLTFIVYYFIPIRKKVVIDNLTHAFPEYDREKINKIAFECYRSFLITVIELLLMKKMSREEIENQVTAPNRELITLKFREGKGVIMLSAHLGNWEFLAASVAAQVNLPHYIVVKSQRNPYVNNWINETRTKWTNFVIPLGVSIRQVYQELKNKNIIAMVADQRGPAEGIKLDFFGRKTSVYTGPAILSLKTGAPLIYGIAVRQPDYSYQTELIEINLENLPEGEDEKITEITRRQIEYLESMIRLYPEQWLWMHKRWKH